MKTKRILLETILVSFVAIPQAKTPFALLPPVYLLIERRLRQRTWAELGFKFATFWEDLRANWFYFVLVGVIMQPLIVLIATALVPAYLEHVVARLSFPQGISWYVLVPLLAFSLIGEELTFRSLIQGRLTPFIGSTGAILLASSLFGVAHLSPGMLFVVVLDIAGF